ncbi:uncharacterized protein LOC112347219 [Selaginella moellendorffii]|uniref:uncharacterized protein LOC112347219 n=1 Tax=Selaginella moellendorffii TaxID=88036 RepID=UPI000D1D0B7F|nr:uncharacterized protein LOC112347219 [Selaginella moellendorffii]XP_024533514.1 uncharacterized protein LOC112347219 [Selaginella moellendorffii]|eukprot:XP_024533513.1 uncharacterized protein LOC112347219 [Selaginella moellendorffii]
MATEGTLQSVSLALDWTANTNHVGFYVAQALGYYKEEGISVEFLSPHVSNYEVTPASQVSARQATFGLAPSETVISYHLPPARSKLVAVAAVLQDDLSAIATLKQSGLCRPRDLDGKVYASYAARFEGRIVQKLIQADGGAGNFEEATPDKLGIWNTLLQNKADATWIFRAWEGVQAKRKGIELNEFILEEYGIPYCYSPVVIAHPDTLEEKPDVVRGFLRASAKGFAYSTANIESSAKILLAQAPEHLDDLDMVMESLEFLSKTFLANPSGEWGTMASGKWSKFLDWLSANKMLTTRIQSRNPNPGVSVSLRDLLTSDGSSEEQIRVNANDLFSNNFL